VSAASERAARLALEPLRDSVPVQGLVRDAIASLRQVWDYRELLGLLVRREIKAKYKNSILGVIWSLIRPLVQLGIFYVIMGMLMNMRAAIPHFAIYAFAGITVWSLVQEIINSGTNSILANSGIVKKTQLPRELFPLASTGSALFNFFFMLVILIVAVLATSGLVPSINFLHFPLALAVILVWGMALAFLLSSLNVYFRDIQYLTEVILMIGFYASPIIYPWSLVQNNLPHVVVELYLANPMTLAVMGTQRVLWNPGPGVAYAYPPFLAYRLLAALVVGLVVLVLCHRVFSRLQRDFAQEM